MVEKVGNKRRVRYGATSAFFFGIMGPLDPGGKANPGNSRTGQSPNDGARWLLRLLVLPLRTVRSP